MDAVREWNKADPGAVSGAVISFAYVVRLLWIDGMPGWSRAVLLVVLVLVIAVNALCNRKMQDVNNERNGTMCAAEPVEQFLQRLSEGLQEWKRYPGCSECRS